jgi:hypothetical protein
MWKSRSARTLAEKELLTIRSIIVSVRFEDQLDESSDCLRLDCMLSREISKFEV